MSDHPWRPDFAGSPCFAGLSAHVEHFCQFADWPTLADLNRRAEHCRLANAQGLPLRFDAQLKRCGQRDYEDGIHASGVVPTRTANWHDFFNALIWLSWPRAKAALNAFQHRHLGEPANGGRGPASDAATLFDESGVVMLATNNRLATHLRARRWQAAFVEERADWAEVRIYIFGHALLEKSRSPLPGITGKCLALSANHLPEPGAEIADWLDDRVADVWRSDRVLSPSALFPIPLLGIPGFDPENTRPGYYDNPTVFRPAPG